MMRRVTIGLKRLFLGGSLYILMKRGAVRKVQVLLVRKVDRNLRLVDLPLNNFVIPKAIVFVPAYDRSDPFH
jgi:hypothetical protein